MLAVLIAGCAAHRDPPTPESDIAPLSETELIELAERIAAQLTVYARGAPTADPVILGYPAVTGGAESAVSPFLVDAIVNAVQDRLLVPVRFNEPGGAPGTLHTTVRLHPAAGGAPAEIEFIARDAATQSELVREVVELSRTSRAPLVASAAAPVVEPPPPRTAERAAARNPLMEPPPWRPIKLNADARALAAWLIEQWPNLKDRTVRSRTGGAVVFVDRRTRDMLTVQTQRSSDAADRLRVEIDARAKDRDRRIAVRVLFLNAERQVIETTPALPYHLLSDYTTTIAIDAAGAMAKQYVVLLQVAE